MACSPAGVTADAADAVAEADADADAAGPAAAPRPTVSVASDAAFSMRRMCPIRHDFHHHPLMQIDRLQQLARSLMTTRQCRFIVPGARDDSPFDHKSRPGDGRDVDEVFARIEQPGSWIALYNVQTDPEYARFVQEVVASAGRIVRDQERVYEVRGFIFISAPPSVTPFHIDREHNFWLQIRGRKTLSVWDHRDRETVPARDVDDFIAFRSLERVRLTEAARGRASTFECGPGDGVYFPSTSPHMTHTEPSWVTPGDGVVISIGVVFYSDLTRRHAHVHTLNGVLRRFGLQPRMPGERAWLDRAKAPLGRAVVALRRRFRGYSAPPGF